MCHKTLFYANRMPQKKTFFLNKPNKMLKKCDKIGFFFRNELLMNINTRILSVLQKFAFVCIGDFCQNIIGKDEI